MNSQPTLPRPASAARAIALVALLGLAGLVPAEAGQLGVPFTVRVSLAADNTGVCRSTRQIGVFGTAVTVNCATGAPVAFSGNTRQLPWAAVPDGPFRYLFSGAGSGAWLGSVESHTGPGVVTTWNVVRLPSFEYLELMVTW